MAVKFLPYTGEDDGLPRIREVQEKMIQRMLAEPTKAILQASDMGVGKTLLSVEMILRLDLKRVLIVGVKDTFEQFEERLALQSDGRVGMLRIDSTKKGRANLAAMLAGEPGIFFAGIQFITTQDWERVPAFNGDGSPKWTMDKKTGFIALTEAPADEIGPRLIPTREMKRQQKFIYKRMPALDMTIWDEIDMGSNRKSLASFTMASVKSDWRIGMSGTFYGNKFANAWTVARWLWPKLIDRSFIRWKDEWCKRKTIYVHGGREQEVIEGELIEGKFVSTLPCYIRKEADEKPPKPKLVYVDLTPTQRAQYEILEQDLLLWMHSRQEQGLAPLVAEAPIALRSRLRTAALGEMSFDENGEVGFAFNTESSKLAALRGILDHYEREQPGKPVAIYTHDKRFAKVVVARMQAANYSVVEWSGDVTTQQRKGIKRRFLAGEIQYIVAVIRSFRAGLDGFQTVCNRVVWLSEQEGDQAANTQSLARFFRPGRVGEFEHVKILARDTHDMGVYGQLVQLDQSMQTTMRHAA